MVVLTLDDEDTAAGEDTSADCHWSALIPESRDPLSLTVVHLPPSIDIGSTDTAPPPPPVFQHPLSVSIVVGRRCCSRHLSTTCSGPRSSRAWLYEFRKPLKRKSLAKFERRRSDAAVAAGVVLLPRNSSMRRRRRSTTADRRRTTPEVVTGSVVLRKEDRWFPKDATCALSPIYRRMTTIGRRYFRQKSADFRSPMTID